MSLSNEAILRSISNDRALASAMLFGHRHRQASPKFHISIIDLWRSADELVVIEAFRQGAKTTLSEEFLLTEALFKNFNYCLIFGETYTKACERIAGMKHEILTNPKIKNLFGNMKGPTWSENRIVLANNVCIEAHGWEEEIRGYLFLDSRPDRAYLDDIENKERVRDTATVNENWRKLYMQLIPAMDKTSRKIRMTGTPLAEDCMIRRAAASPNWTCGKFPLASGPLDDPATESLWPERYPVEWCRAEQKKFSDEGLLREFNQEFMLIATGAQGKPFTEEHIREVAIAPIEYSPRVVIMDPARTVDVKKSDQTGHVTVSRVGTRFYVHESGAEYWQPDEIVKGAYDMSARHDDAEVVIEKNSLDDWLMQPIRALGLLLGRMLNMRAVNAPQEMDKASFIMGLRPFFMAGDIILVGGRAKHPKLVSQILNFPSGKRDCLNALAYILRVFNWIPVYGDFGQANIAQGASLSRNAQLLLGCNSTGAETTAVLIAADGRNMTVLADWVSPLMPNDSIPDIATLIRAVYPGRKVTAWVPADIFDQVGRNPLIAALKSAGLPANRAENAIMSRGALSPLIRTEINGRRMFQVDEQARHTLQALASGYNWPVKSGGERASEPARSPARTLIEAVECLTYAISRPQNTALNSATNAVNSSGTAYMSALPGRK
jgi:phage terminase large subunit-like protein